MAVTAMGFRKTTVEIDADALREAEENLGTHGLKETVNTALREVNRRAALARAADHVRRGAVRVPEEAVWAAWRDPRGHP